MAMTDFDLRGKDWLTETEAAHYCGVSLRQFQDHARRFRVRRFMGKKLYSRAELFDAILQSPLWCPVVERPAVVLSTGVLARNLTSERLRPYKPRKKTGEGS